MSRIRFKGTAASAVPVPPAGKASLFYDHTDNALKMKLPSGDTLALGVTEEYIQDLVGDMLTDSSSLSSSYDDATATLSIDLKPGIINDSHIDKISPTKINDAQNGRFETSIITNNSSPVSAFSMACAEEGCWMVELKVTARRLGGLAGSPGDGASFKRSFRVKSVGSSVTLHDMQSDYTSRDDSRMNVAVTVSSTDVVVNVVGVEQNNIKWNIDVLSSVNK